MVKYMLTSADEEQWRRFKACCDLEGITIKQFLLECIVMFTSSGWPKNQDHIADRKKPKQGGKKK